MNKRIQLWSCGGGRQSAGIAALILQCRLPRPDHVVMCALRRERKATFKYVNAYVRPAIQSLGIPFTYVSSKKYATVGYWSGQDGQSTVLPVYSDQSGVMSKLSEYCSGEWKREVTKRWANEQPGWKERGVDNWIGISWDERDRRRASRTQWFQVVYPLLDWMPKAFPVNACLDAVEAVGWPPPPRSRCEHCPNQTDAEWAELTPEEWKRSCDLEDELRKTDRHLFFHKSLIPLRQVTLNPKEKTDGMFGGCSAGMCY